MNPLVPEADSPRRTFEANCSATAIGSFPHNNVDEACQLILKTIPEIPCWPQLPKRDMREEMCIQYTEGFPCLKLLPEEKRIFYNNSGDTSAPLEAFYEKYLQEDPSLFPISENYSIGFPTMLKYIEKTPPAQLRFLKGQIVGPITLAATIKDTKGMPIIYDETANDAVIKLLSMKACWQLDILSKYKATPIIFADEPSLASFGTPFLSISREKVISSLNEIFDAIHRRGGIAGIHCCANTDWAMLMETTVDIISFDAFEYMEKLLMYWREIDSFFKRGGILAWGIVPTSSEVANVTTKGLIKKMESGIEYLTGKGIDRQLIRERALITPSCGTGTLTVEESEKAMFLTAEVSGILKEKYFNL
ncbi:MAG TPA: hypothetical protein ACFYD6_04025 [Candidatus Brocadiia bacterium]|nr:hypothetical protein [Candidatus Brocadiales bacterium]